jgi:cobyrinic acid a,c-diamide synthase
MSLVIAGERSGAGKTTLTMALLAYLRRCSDRVQSFKVGPDYIDPMFHQFVTDRACRNLDPLLTSESYVQRCFAQHTQAAEYGLVEGVMGLFDGAGASDFASTAHIARLLNLPVLLVIDCARLSRSVAAIAHGYRSFDPRLTIAGVVLNRVGSDRHLSLLKSALEPLNLPVLGVLRRHEEVTIPDRHLGLVPTDELPALRQVVDRLAVLAEMAFDWSRLLPLLRVGQPSLAGNGEQPTARETTVFEALPSPQAWTFGDRSAFGPGSSQVTESGICANASAQLADLGSIRIAIARDPAFNFYYADNLEILQQLGAELVFWSPIRDRSLPDGISGLYLGGGFPEMFAADLEGNLAMRQAVKRAIATGIPTYAECGGLMYLSREITDFEGHCWEMTGVLPTETLMDQRLTLGYRRAIALHSTPLLTQGQEVWGHEFHRSHLSVLPDQPLYRTQGYDPDTPVGNEGWHLPNLHASYVHLHWGDRLEIPKRFIALCMQYSALR